MSKNPIDPWPNFFFRLSTIFIPIHNLYEHLKPLTAFKIAKMRYFGRIEAPKGPKNCLKTLQPSAPEIFWGLQLFLSSYMTFLSLSMLLIP